MKRFGGMNIIENRADVVEAVVEWNETWDGDDEEMAVNAEILEWINTHNDDEFAKLMYGKSAMGLNRMTIQVAMRQAGIIK